VGQTITANPCSVNAATGGIQTAVVTRVEIRARLGFTFSQFTVAQVSINPTTGEVTLNNIATGQTVTLQLVTGSTGG
jgi:diacylglycerol kinase family enzyme